MKIVFFGAGKKLDKFMRETEISKYLDVAAILDNSAEKAGVSFNGFHIQSPETLRELDYDKIVVSAYYDEIMPELVKKYNINENDIIRIEELLIPDLFDLGTITLNCDNEKAYSVRDLTDEQIVTSNKFEEFFFQKEHRRIHKLWHYFEIYETFFAKYSGKPVRMLEIGVNRGGSLQMWKNYFGKGSRIIGIDIDSECKQFEEEGVTVCIGSQAEPEFLKKVVEEYGPFDIILDDGSHMVEHQIISFEVLFPLLVEGGLYLCEDTCTSYWKSYGGGLYEPSSFIEYSKNLVDEINYGNMEDRSISRLSKFQGMIKAIHFYDSMVVMEKKKKGRFFEMKNGIQK